MPWKVLGRIHHIIVRVFELHVSRGLHLGSPIVGQAVASPCRGCHASRHPSGIDVIDILYLKIDSIALFLPVFVLCHRGKLATF